MLILLPPSETKRPGGRGRPVAWDRLALPALTPQRNQTVDALVALSAEPAESARVLGLSAAQLGEIEVNAGLRAAPTMAAIDRFTGVLFDALDVDALDAAGRRWLGGNVMIHTALLGPVGALDPIPAYRLAAGTAVPGLPPLRRVWASAVTQALEDFAPSFVLDLRSESYVALGPVPAGIPSAYLRVVTESADGSVRALNHFNKHAKGALVHQLARERPRMRTLAGFLAWASAAGVAIRGDAASGELELVVG